MDTPDIEGFLNEILDIAFAPGVVGSHLAENKRKKQAGIGHVGLHRVDDISPATRARLEHLRDTANCYVIEDVARIALKKAGDAGSVLSNSEPVVAKLLRYRGKTAGTLSIQWHPATHTGVATLSFNQARPAR